MNLATQKKTLRCNFQIGLTGAIVNSLPCLIAIHRKKILSSLILLTSLCLLTPLLYANKSDIKFAQIESIKNPDERAVAWLIYAFEVAVKNPKAAPNQLIVDTNLFPENYQHRKVIKAITNAEIHKINGAHNQAIINTAEAIQALEKTYLSTSTEKKILALSYIAHARFTLYSKAEAGIKYGYKALQLAHELDFSTGKIFAHNEIGILISYLNKDFDLALKHFNKAKDLLPHASPSVRHFMKGFVLGNIAKTWAELGDIQKSIDYKLELLASGNSKDNVELIMGTHNNLGTNYYELKQYDLAKKHLQATLSLMDQHQIHTNRGIPLYRLGLIEFELGNLHLVNAYIDAIDYWLIDHQFIRHYLVDFYQLKSKVAKSNLDFEQAMLWLEKASTEQESFNQLSKANNIVKLEEENRLHTIQEEKLLLEKERKANEVKIRTQRLQLFTASLIIMLGFSYFFIFYSKRKKIEAASSSSQVLVDEESTNSKKVNIDIALQQKILDALVKEKLYLNQNLTLKKFADHLDSNTSYVSKTINDGFDKNYSTLINHFRVQEVQRAFLAGDHQKLTIESIYKKAGFKSKSAFQKAFKSQLGVTASNYINNLTSTFVNVHN